MASPSSRGAIRTSPPSLRATARRRYGIARPASRRWCRSSSSSRYRCRQAVPPERVAALTEADLRGAGLTRQKSAYIRDIAQAIVAGDFDPNALADLDDDEARLALIKLRGVGA